MLAVRRWAELSDAERERLLARSTAAVFEPALMASLDELFADVRARGDHAVLDATERFDGVRLPPDRLTVSAAEIDAAHASLAPGLLAGIRVAIANSRRFNEAQLAATARDWQVEVHPGVLVGERFAAIPSAGLFVPTGKASYPSVLCQIGTPAVVAGVERIAVVVPPIPGSAAGDVDPATLAVAKELGIATVIRANGPAGIAALTFGTATVQRVAKIVGPGSPAVTAAQVLAQRYGTATQMLCGPSESLLIADESADPWRLALDLVNEAEHGADSAATLVTDSADAGRGGRGRRRPPARRPARGPGDRGAGRAVRSRRRHPRRLDGGGRGGRQRLRRRARPGRHPRSRGDGARAALRRRGPARAGHPDRCLELHDRDPRDPADRRLRAAQRRGHRADVPDLDARPPG